MIDMHETVKAIKSLCHSKQSGVQVINTMGVKEGFREKVSLGLGLLDWVG